jgi:hypothetical protein
MRTFAAREHDRKRRVIVRAVSVLQIDGFHGTASVQHRTVHMGQSGGIGGER